MTPRERTMADIGLIALRHGITRHDVLRKHSRCRRAMAARRDAAILLAKQGRKMPDIARALNRDRSTIYYILNKVKKHGKHASQSQFANDNSDRTVAGDNARTG